MTTIVSSVPTAENSCNAVLRDRSADHGHPVRVITVDGMQNAALPGDCLAAIERRRLDVHSQYGPADVDLPRRCEFFLPLRDADDQRTGRERYPTLWAEYEAKQDRLNGFRRDAAQRGLERAKAAIGHNNNTEAGDSTGGTRS